MIHAHGLSAALFAPGWVYENQDKENFFEHQNKFWTLLAPFCTTYPISSLPIVSSFGRGFGKHVTIDGEVGLYTLLIPNLWYFPIMKQCTSELNYCVTIYSCKIEAVHVYIKLFR